MVCAKRTQSLITRANLVVAHIVLTAFCVQIALKQSAPFWVTSESSIRCSTREDQEVQHPLSKYGYPQQEE